MMAKRKMGSETDPVKVQAIYEKMLAKAYEVGKATEAASYLEIDAVIDPQDSRQVILRSLDAWSNCRIR